MDLLLVIDKIKAKIREKTNRIFAKGRRKKLTYSNFTIISNNCWGGHVYRYFGIQYLSPTVGLFFFQEDFIKFCNNLEFYINSPLEFINYDESKYSSYLKNKKYKCPLGKLNDIEIVFLHYETKEEAFEKWNRRCKRINWNNIFIKDSEQNLCTEKDILDFDKIGYKNKFIFTTNDYKIDSQVLFDDGYLGEKNIPNDTINFRKYIDLIKWLNNESNYKLKQKKIRRKISKKI